MRFISHDIQNEMIELYSNAIVQKLVSTIKSNGIYSVICDGTQDISGCEQESISIRHVDEDLFTQETFLRMYCTPNTSGNTLAEIILNVLKNLDLSISELRGQVYDGAANMSGLRNGCQAIIKSKSLVS